MLNKCNFYAFNLTYSLWIYRHLQASVKSDEPHFALTVFLQDLFFHLIFPRGKVWYVNMKIFHCNRSETDEAKLMSSKVYLIQI